jgi:hypothetical protein
MSVRHSREGVSYDMLLLSLLYCLFTGLLIRRLVAASLMLQLQLYT